MPKYWRKPLFRCQVIDYKSHLNLPGIEPGPPRRQSSYVLPKNVNTEVLRAVNFVVVLCGCVFRVKEVRGLKVFDNRVLTKISGSKRDKVKEAGENCILSFIIFFVVIYY
jgi:hypothetical protein